MSDNMSQPTQEQSAASATAGLSNSQVKARRPRFKGEEIEVLLDSALKYRPILTGKHSSIVTEERKKNVWASIAERVNSVSSVTRTIRELQDKLRHFTSEAKNENAKINRAKSQSGGPPPDNTLSVLQLKALEYVGHVATDGVPGGLSAGMSAGAGGEEAGADDSEDQESEVNEPQSTEGHQSRKRRRHNEPAEQLTKIQQGILHSLGRIEGTMQQQAQALERQANAMDLFLACVKLHLGVETIDLEP